MIYLDYNATTPLAPEVADSIKNSLDAWGNPSSKYPAGQNAKKLIAEARGYIATCINAKAASEVIFTSGGTEANNWVIHSSIEYTKRSIKAGGDLVAAKPHVVTTSVEHDSVLAPLQHLQKSGVIELSIVEVDSNGTGSISPIAVSDAVKSNTVLVSVMMANNETGTILPVKEICCAVRKKEGEHESKIFFHTDAAQVIGKLPVDVQDLDVDFLTVVGHKFYGPRNGALYIKNIDSESHLYAPLLFGGGQERGWRAGTENTPMIVGLGMAARLVIENLEKYRLNMLDTRDYLRMKLLKTFGKDRVKFNCISNACLPNTCNFSIIGSGLEGHKVLERAQKFCCSTGSACHSDKCEPSKILLKFHIPHNVACNALRISTGRVTTRDDIDVVVAELKEIVQRLS